MYATALKRISPQELQVAPLSPLDPLMHKLPYRTTTFCFRTASPFTSETNGRRRNPRRRTELRPPSRNAFASPLCKSASSFPIPPARAVLPIPVVRAQANLLTMVADAQILPVPIWPLVRFRFSFEGRAARSQTIFATTFSKASCMRYSKCSDVVSVHAACVVKDGHGVLSLATRAPENRLLPMLRAPRLDLRFRRCHAFSPSSSRPPGAR